MSLEPLALEEITNRSNPDKVGGSHHLKFHVLEI